MFWDVALVEPPKTVISIVLLHLLKRNRGKPIQPENRRLNAAGALLVNRQLIEVLEWV